MEEKTLYFFENDRFHAHHIIAHFPDPHFASFRSHSHNMHEIYYFQEGEADYAVEGKIHTLTPGTLIVTAQGQTHNILIRPGAAVYERTVIMFAHGMLPERLWPVMEVLGRENHAFFFQGRERAWLEEFFQLMENNALQGGDEILLSALVTSILSKLALFLANQSSSMPVRDELVRDIIHFVDNNMEREWHLEDLEKALFRSKAYLNRRFKSVMGCGIWEYNLRKRIFAAQQQLFLSKSIAEAYRASGFQDYSVFYRRYKKYTGLSPSEELKKIKSE